MITLKVFGERNTGTNAACAMLDSIEGCVVMHGAPEDYQPDAFARFEPKFAMFPRRWRRFFRDAVSEYVLEDAPPLFAWKHASPQFDPAYDDPSIGVILMVKQPFSWLVSLWHRPYGVFGPPSRTFESFLDRPWRTLRCEGEPALLDSPVALWNRKLAAYAAFIDAARETRCKTFPLRFEEFIANPVEICRPVLACFGLPGDGLRPVARSMKSKRHSIEDVQAFYREERWRSTISAKAWRAIEQQVDWSVAERFGYMPTDFDPRRRSALSGLNRRLPRKWRRH